ncbi:hypothetical protein HA402_014807 [Bradysia odoriphaga]|nr:hypothetical protein HA402_014807 [Bradysia odoriphaga]
MVDTARQLLDELMGRNRNLDPSTAICRKINWDDPEFCLYFLVKFCPHDLFVNTRADLGACPKIHDEEAKKLYDEARPSKRKRNYEDEFLRFSNHMLNEVDRKISKGKQRLLLMNKGDGAPVYVSKFQEQLNNLNARIKKLIGEAEEAGNRGDVDQAQGLMTLCDQLKEEKEALVNQHENGGPPPTSPSNATSSAPGPAAWNDFTSTEKQMEVCEVCGAFLIVGDAQQRLEDHLTGKQHMGYSKLRKAVDEMYEKRRNMDRDEEDRLNSEDRRSKSDNGNRDRRDGKRREDYEDRRRDRRDDRNKRDFDRGSKDRRDGRSSESDRRGDGDRRGDRSHRDRDRNRYNRDDYRGDRDRDVDRDRERSRRRSRSKH